MSTKPNYIGIALALSIGAAFGFVGVSHLNEKRDFLNEELTQEKENWDIKLQENSPFDRGEDEGGMYLVDVTSWVAGLSDMPDSEERKAFASIILKATNDSVISEEEFESIKSARTTLLNANINTRTRGNATKIRNGEDIVEDRSALEQMDSIMKNYRY